MSSLHPDRLPTEDAAPATGEQALLPATRRTLVRRRGPAGATAHEDAGRTATGNPIRTRRTGTPPARPGDAPEPAATRRRPVLFLAGSLIGVLTIGSIAASGPSASAETRTVSHSVSVAAQLGIEAEPAQAITDADVREQLGGLAASRAERAAEQTDAQRAQVEADAEAQAAAEEAARIAAEAARPKAVLPVPGARLTSGFGARWGTLHAGIDLAAPMRTPEYAVMDGVVLEAGPASGYGLAVYIQHENGDVTVYGHMDEILVSAGQVVQAGDTIALLGNRGQSTGPHLHFEVRTGGLDGTKIDPLPWLRERGLDI